MYYNFLHSSCTYQFHLNPYLTNGIAHHYHLDKSTFILRDIGCVLNFLFDLSMEFLKANRKAPDGTPRSVASHLGLYCLSMSHKKGRQA